MWFWTLGKKVWGKYQKCWKTWEKLATRSIITCLFTSVLADYVFFILRWREKWRFCVESFKEIIALNLRNINLLTASQWVVWGVCTYLCYRQISYLPQSGTDISSTRWHPLRLFVFSILNIFINFSTHLRKHGKSATMRFYAYLRFL